MKLVSAFALLAAVASAPITMVPSGWWRTTPQQPVALRDAPFWDVARACRIERQRLDDEERTIAEGRHAPQQTADQAYWLKVRQASFESAKGDYRQRCER